MRIYRRSPRCAPLAPFAPAGRSGGASLDAARDVPLHAPVLLQVKYAQPAETTAFLAAALAETSFFEMFDEHTLRELAEQMCDVHCCAGDEVIVQGDEGDRLFLVGSGEFQVRARACSCIAGARARLARARALAALSLQSSRTLACASDGRRIASHRRPSRVQAFLDDSPVAVSTYSSGAMFGELAVLYNSPRAATIRCAADGTLWALSLIHI